MIQSITHYVKTLYVVLDPKQDNIQVFHNHGATVKEMGQTAGADIAMNFNFADINIGQPLGRLIVDGKTVVDDLPKTRSRDELYMMPDGSWFIGKAPAGAVQSVQGSPRLLRDGKNVIHETLIRDQTPDDIKNKNIRVAAGITPDKKLVLARTLGKVYLSELAEIMLKLGCVDALNGDGGGSAYLWPHDAGWGRKMGSAIVAKKGVKEMKPVLIIDAGHGGSDPGAIGNGIVEKDYTLMISLYQHERFKQLGVPVALTRDRDTFIDSTPRATMVKNSGAKYCISNHINASGGEGVETIHSIFAKPDLASKIAREIAAAGQKFRRVFSREGERLLVDASGKPILDEKGQKQYVPSGADYYFMHRLTGSVSTVIVEYGFVDNKSCAERVKANWEKYAEAVVKAFCNFAGYAYKPPKSPANPPVTPPVTSDDLPRVSGTVNVLVNNKEVDGGFIIDGRTYVPLRSIGDALGMQVGWDQATKTASLKGGK